MLMLSEEFVSEIKSRNDIEEVVGEYVNLQRKGKNLMGVCPFHSERTASFCVYPSNGSFYCFGCGAGGDVITFLRLAEHYDYVEAVKKLAERAGMDFEISEEDNALHNKKLMIYKLNREAAKFYHKSLFSPEGKKSLEYLEKRGINMRSIKHFGLGFSPPSGYALVDYLKKMGYNGEDMVLANLAFETRSLKQRDRFRNRLMFPIIDARGNVIAFGARTMGGDMPKYLNTSDTPVFKKSSNLFALNFAKKTVENKLILTEGYMDVVSLHQAGFENAVAGLGTALTSGQVKLIGRYADEVLISYDSDEPGQKAAARAIDMLKSNGISVKIISIPKAKDPDEYIRSNGKDGAVKFKSLIENSKNDIEYQLSKIRQKCNFELSEDKINYLKEASKIVASCTSPIEREVYALKLSVETNISKSAVLLQINALIRKKLKKYEKKEFKDIEKITSAVNDKINSDKHKNLRAASAEESLLSCMLSNADLVKEKFLNVDSDFMITGFNRKIFECIKDIVSKGKILDINSMRAYGFSFEEIGRITKIMCSYNSLMNSSEAVNEYINVIKEENKKKKISDINNVSETEVKEYINSLKNQK